MNLLVPKHKKLATSVTASVAISSPVRLAKIDSHENLGTLTSYNKHTFVNKKEKKRIGPCSTYLQSICNY